MHANSTLDTQDILSRNAAISSVYVATLAPRQLIRSGTLSYRAHHRNRITSTAYLFWGSGNDAGLRPCDVIQKSKKLDAMNGSCPRRSTRPELNVSITSDASLREHNGFDDAAMAQSPLSFTQIALISSGLNTPPSSISPRIPFSISSPIPVFSAILQKTCLLAFARSGRYFSIFLPYTTIHPFATILVLHVGTMSFPRAPDPQRTFDIVSFRAAPISL